jgi:Periplasmic copper-binding protein (NosD)
MIYRPYLLLAFLATVLAPSWAWSATITVNGGGSLRQAAQQLRPGDTLLLGNGQYEDGLGCEIPSGSPGNPTTIQAAPGAQPVIVLRGNGSVGISLGSGCDQAWIVLDGLTITGQERATGEGIHLHPGASHITVQNTDIADILGNGTCAPSQGIAFSESNNNVFLNNRIHDLGQNDPPPEVRSCNFTYGTYMPSNGNIWENNLFYNISAFAIHGYPDPQGNTIRNNTLCNTGPLLMRGSGNTIEGNRLFHVGRTVYPFEQGQTIMSSSGNNTSNNQISDGDGNCASLSPTPSPRPPGSPPRPRLPAPRHLRILTR